MTYIPFDVLLSVVLAEKDAYIKELMEKLSKCDSELHHNFSGLEGYNINDVKAIIRKDAEVIALKTKIASLQAELEEQKNNISDKKLDLILNENDSLKMKLKNTEEILQELMKIKNNQEESRNNELNNYDFQEKTISIEKNELFQHKNEETAKLKIQLENESKKVNDFIQQTEESSIFSERGEFEKTFSDYLDEIKFLKEENNRMKERIDELQWYEKQYDKLKDKLCESEIAARALTEDNRNLMNKIKGLEEQISSNRSENQGKFEIESSGKELVLDERYCHAKTDDENEIQRLRMKIKFLSSKLQKSSGELQEERNRVQTLQKEVNQDWSSDSAVQTEKASFFEEENFYLLKENFDPVFEIKGQISSFVNAYEKKEAMSYKEVQHFLESSKKIIAFVLENMMEYQKEMEELRIHNRIMKDELEELKTDLSQTDVNELLRRIDKLNNSVEEKNLEIENLTKRRKEEFNSDRKEVDELKELIRMLRMLLGDVKEENRVLNEELESQKGEKRNLEKNLGNDIKYLTKQKGVLENQLAKLICEINKMDDVINEQKDEIELLRSKNVEVASSRNNNLRSLESEATDFQEIIEIPKIDYEKFLNEKNALESALHHLSKEFAELKKELEGMTRLKNETIKLKCERDGLLEKIARSEIEIQDLKAKFSECSHLKNQLAKLKPIETALGKKLSALNTRKESVKTREILNLNGKLINEINELKSENDKLKNILQDLKKNLEERKKQKESNPGAKGGHSVKLKTLIRQHDKEMKARDKIFNEALNSVKSNYECDVRKLIERHKGSILKLQNLHEDEIQELNTNYETQMEQLQTQHEKILNDSKLDSAEKINRLTEQLNQEAKNLEFKFQQILHEKETEHMFQISKLQLKITENDILNEDLNLKKKLKKTNAKRLEMMTSKYEEDRKRCEDLKTGGKNWWNFEFSPEIYIDPFAFNLDCPAEGNIPTRENHERCPPSPAKSSKEELLNKIIILENNMEFNRMEMQKAVGNVEKISAKRLKEMENLFNEQERKNSELQILLANYNAEKKMFDEEVLKKNKEIEKQRAEKKVLEEELSKQNDRIKSLKEKYKNQRRKDLEYIESMRLRLEQELDSERR